MTGPKPDLEFAKLSCRLDHHGAVLRIVLCDPPGNVLDSEMTASLRGTAAAVGAMPDVKLLVFEGEGRHFSFGASVEEHLPDRVEGMLRDFHALFRELMRTDVPAVALVRGQCLGGGLELAAFCDHVVAEEGASLGQPEIKLGVFAPMGSLLLPWRCRGAAADLLLAGTSVDAPRALAIGLVDAVAPAGEGERVLDEWIREHVLPKSASSLRRARRAARWTLHRLLDQGLDELETLYLEDLMATRDAVEGIEAFLEKRKPAWKNE